MVYLENVYSFYNVDDLPQKLSCEHVHRECIMLMTSPCVDARRDRGPVHTNKVTI